LAKIFTDLEDNEHFKIKKTRKNIENAELKKLFSIFRKNILNKKIEKVERKGKNILIFLSDDNLLLIHQKLSGHLLLGKWKIKKGEAVSLKNGVLNERINKYIHLIFYLSDGNMLALSDLRKFAKIILGPREEVLNLPEIKKLGPDPTSKGFSLKIFKELLKKRKGNIKTVLLNQEIISGIGNIYADEVLWFSRIHPLTPVEDLSGIKLNKMYNTIKDILKFSIKIGGDSMSDFRNIYGKKGGYQDFHKVYGRKGQSCFLCKTKIERIKIGARSSHFCPKCQK